MKLYRIANWNELYENNRSRKVGKLAWVPMPNRHDGENYTTIVTHRDGAILLAAWVLIVQVASKCQPRGTLVRDNGTPHNSASLSAKTRAPQGWFDLALPWLESNTDWIEYQDDAGGWHRGGIAVASRWQAGDEEQNRTEGTEGREEKRENAPHQPSVDLPIELPHRFPKTEAEALLCCAAVGAEPEFIKRTWAKAVSRGGKDAREVEIRSFAHHVAVEWGYERERRSKQNGNEQPNVGTTDKIMWNKEMERMLEERRRLKDGAATDAMGAKHYTPHEKNRIAELNTKIKACRVKLGLEDPARTGTEAAK